MKQIQSGSHIQFIRLDGKKEKLSAGYTIDLAHTFIPVQKIDLSESTFIPYFERCLVK